MLQKAELIYRKADDLVQRCGTRDTLRIADKIGIYTHYLDNLQELLGLYSYRHKERHVLLNSNMDYIATQMVCGHEIGHDTLHRDQAKGGITLQEFTLFDMRNEMEYEANAFAAHLRIEHSTYLIAHVWHISNGSRELWEAARKREARGLIHVTNLADKL